MVTSRDEGLDVEDRIERGVALGFVAGEARTESGQSADFDAALEELLKGGGTEGEGTEGGEKSE